MPGRDKVLTHPATMYAKSATAGRMKAMCCPYEIKACQRHLDDLKRIGDPDFPYVFDVTRADRIYRWFTLCIQSRGPEAGQPVQLQAMLLRQLRELRSAVLLHLFIMRFSWLR